MNKKLSTNAHPQNLHRNYRLFKQKSWHIRHVAWTWTILFDAFHGALCQLLYGYMFVVTYHNIPSKCINNLQTVLETSSECEYKINNNNDNAITILLAVHFKLSYWPLCKWFSYADKLNWKWRNVYHGSTINEFKCYKWSKFHRLFKLNDSFGIFIVAVKILAQHSGLYICFC